MTGFVHVATNGNASNMAIVLYEYWYELRTLNHAHYLLTIGA